MDRVSRRGRRGEDVLGCLHGGILTLTGKLEGGEHEVRQRERTCRGRLISKRGLHVLRRLSYVVVLGGDD